MAEKAPKSGGRAFDTRTIIGWSGNPARISRPFYRSHMQRLSANDWGDIAIHEMSHDFDKDEWCFDYEVLADLKLSYVLQNISGSNIYRVDTMKYYTGSNIYNFFKTDQMDSYDNSFAKGRYHNRGMTAVMLRIKNQIGWKAFEDTFRYMGNLSSAELDFIYASPNPSMNKFNIFMGVDRNSWYNHFTRGCKYDILMQRVKRRASVNGQL